MFNKKIHLSEIKKLAKYLKKVEPEITHAQLLEIATKELYNISTYHEARAIFKSQNPSNKSQNLDIPKSKKIPLSRLALVKLGLSSELSSFKPIDITMKVSWTSPKATVSITEANWSNTD